MRDSEVPQFKNPWDRNGYIVCSDIDRYHMMPCSVGTVFNENLKHCVPEGYVAPICPIGYCKNSGECIMTDDQKLKCLCRKGFTGLKCEENIDECALGGNQACAGGVCVDQVNGFYCSCAKGIGLNCQQTIPNPCTLENLNNEMQFFEVPSASSNAYLQCTGENVFVLSRCADNLFWDNYQNTCSIERPQARTGACSSMPCKNGGECKDLGSNQFECECKNGYNGEFCEKMTDLCASNPCQNSGKCVSFVGGYNCICPEKIIDECCCNGNFSLDT